MLLWKSCWTQSRWKSFWEITKWDVLRLHISANIERINNYRSNVYSEDVTHFVLFRTKHSNIKIEEKIRGELGVVIWFMDWMWAGNNENKHEVFPSVSILHISIRLLNLRRLKMSIYLHIMHNFFTEIFSLKILKRKI